MTTITMEKHILKRLDALEDFAKEIRAALAAPATTPEQPRPFVPWSKEAEMLESWAAQPAPQPERKPKPFIGTLRAIYKCTDCGHEQSVTELHTEHGVYVGSGANWCDKCELGKPERKETP